MKKVFNLFRKGGAQFESEGSTVDGTNTALPKGNVKESNPSQNGSTKSVSDMMDIYHLIILDESGSMDCVARQTIDGCNETLSSVREMQAKNIGTERHLVSIYLFSSGRSRYIMRNVDVKSVKDIKSKDYRPGSCTPLYDAVGYTLSELKPLLKPGKTMAYVTIITDGAENDSHQYTFQDVLNLIDELKALDVIFSFIGANIVAKDYAAQLHINNSMQFEQTDEGMRMMWERERRSKMRSSAHLSFMRKFAQDDMEGWGEHENRGRYYAEADASRFTPDVVTTLGPNEVFVFGSNIQGLHNGGAALLALNRFGAILGQKEGLQGQSYAIPTVGVLEEELYMAIQRFCHFANLHRELTFLVTAIGCGSAGFSPYIVAPMFREAAMLPNVKLPTEFWDYLDCM